MGDHQHQQLNHDQRRQCTDEALTPKYGSWSADATRTGAKLADDATIDVAIVVTTIKQSCWTKKRLADAPVVGLGTHINL
jgi:hypothetical protein